MNRYRAATGPEAEHEPGSKKRVLRNLLGIKSKSAIDEAESTIRITTSVAISESPPQS